MIAEEAQAVHLVAPVLLQALSSFPLSVRRWGYSFSSLPSFHPNYGWNSLWSLLERVET
jgi:hypothetical protein